jgi:hypothetical protein
MIAISREAIAETHVSPELRMSTERLEVTEKRQHGNPWHITKQHATEAYNEQLLFVFQPVRQLS